MIPSDSQSAHAKRDKHIKGELGSKDKTQPQRKVHTQHAVEANEKMFFSRCDMLAVQRVRIQNTSIQLAAGVWCDRSCKVERRAGVDAERMNK